MNTRYHKNTVGLTLLGTVFELSVLFFVNQSNAQTFEVESEPLDGTSEVADSGCVPECRGEFVCRDGRCVSPCLPPCRMNEICSRSGTCVPKTIPEKQTTTPQTDNSAAPVDQSLLLDVLAEQEKDVKEEYSRFAMLVNPLAMASLLPLYGIAVIPIDTQIGWKYAAVDIQITAIVGAMSGFSGELGLRITPFGKGLAGLYIVPRVGGGYPLGFMVSGEIGYAWIIKHFAINLGLGSGWVSEVGFVPFGNLSLGFAV